MSPKVVSAPAYLLHEGDCLEWLRSLPSDSVDSCVTDPPYGLSAEPNPAAVLSAWLKGEEFHHKSKGFMSKTWDSMVPGPTVWKEIHRVLKPGGMLLAFAGTRTWDLMSMAIRLAGFENRDTVRHNFGVPAIGYTYGSGFPKGKSQFKPAWEPILVFRKPGPLREYRIDECRIGTSKNIPASAPKDRVNQIAKGDEKGRTTDTSGFNPNLGRWPANAVFTHSADCVRMCANDSNVADWQCADGCPVKVLGEQSGVLKSVNLLPGHKRGDGPNVPYGGGGIIQGTYGGDTGTAARFFHQFQQDESESIEAIDTQPLDLPTFIYQAKASRSERERGCEGLPEKSPAFGSATGDGLGRGISGTRQDTTHANHHPTVKPLALLRHLCRLVTPVGGVVIDPFAGSGTTGCAAMLEGLSFLGAERETEYVAIARARIGYYFAQTPIDRKP